MNTNIVIFVIEAMERARKELTTIAPFETIIPKQLTDKIKGERNCRNSTYMYCTS